MTAQAVDHSAPALGDAEQLLSLKDEARDQSPQRQRSWVYGSRGNPNASSESESVAARIPEKKEEPEELPGTRGLAPAVPLQPFTNPCT